MARHADHAKAIEMRKQGKSYSEIKEALGVGKGTLSAWLRDYPLSRKDLARLREKNPRRVELFRATMLAKRQERLDEVYKKVAKDLHVVHHKHLFTAGFYLYWAEGGKTTKYTVTMANTDPSILLCFLDWVELLGWDRKKVTVRLQLYADMNVKDEVQYWQQILHLPRACFGNPYIKKTNRTAITYKGGFTHGTCNILIHNRDVTEYVLMGIRFLRNYYIDSRQVFSNP